MDGRDGARGAPGVKGERGFSSRPWGSGGCPGVTFHFPRANQVTDYVRYRAYFPMLSEATVCMWIVSSDFSGRIAPMSYAVPGQYNELVFTFLTPQIIEFFTRGSHVNVPVSTFTGIQKFHLCGWFSSRRQRRAVYLNATRVQLSGFNGVLQGGGDLILGQEQDGVNASGLNANQAFSGNITNFMIWPRVLTDQELSDVARNCECPWDYSVAMTFDRAELHGSVRYSLYEECPVL